jgi:protein gp37
MNNELVQFRLWRDQVVAATTIGEASHAYAQYDGIRKLALSLKNRKHELEAAEIAIKAERKLGELILAASKAGALAKGSRGQGRPKKGAVFLPRLNEPTLLSAGVDTNLAKRARALGKLDDNDFDERFDLWRKRYNGRSNERVTTKLPPLHHARAASRAKIRASNIVLKDWEKLSADEQHELLQPNDKSTAQFNRQETAGIEWAQWSWNPVTGCRHDCPYCYARDLAERYSDVYPHGFEPAFRPYMLRAPKNTAVPGDASFDTRFKNVFTCSMADLFGRWVPREWIEAVLTQVEDNPQWNFLFLTKFPKRMSEFKIPPNAWMGTTVDLQARVANAEAAFSRLNKEAGIRWLSIEPMLEPLKFKNLELFNWVVIGGSSRSTKTPTFHPPWSWIADIYKAAKSAGCNVYMKTNLLGNRVLELPFDAPIKKDAIEAPNVFHYLGKDRET